MRLTCPNCGAQYEVPDDVIPFAGRDVQCSNCGNTWFQAHADNPDTAQPEPDDDVIPRARKPIRNEQPKAADTDKSEPSETTEDSQFPRRPLTDDVAGVLREEAEREASLRATEQNTLESQTELGLDDHTNDADRRAAQARARMARIKGEDDPAPAKPAKPAEPDDDEIEAAVSATISSATIDPGAASRRDLLPDIDDISSTLRSTKDTTTVPSGGLQMDELPRKRRSGFARGFSVSILIFAFFVALYIFAPQLARMVPALDPALTAYVATVDQARLWLDTQIAAFVP